MAGRLPEVSLRCGTDQDGSVIATIMAEAYSEYPGCVFDLESELPELRSPLLRQLPDLCHSAEFLYRLRL